MSVIVIWSMIIKSILHNANLGTILYATHQGIEWWINFFILVKTCYESPYKFLVLFNSRCNCYFYIYYFLDCRGNSPYLQQAINGPGKSTNTPLVQCTSHMCPVRVHWHVKLNYKDYWRVKVAITNFNYRMNYSQWNLVVQHPNFNNLTTMFSFNYESLVPFGTISEFPHFTFL